MKLRRKEFFAFLKYSFVIVWNFVATCVLLDYVYILTHVERNVNRFFQSFLKIFFGLFIALVCDRKWLLVSLCARDVLWRGYVLRRVPSAGFIRGHAFAGFRPRKLRVPARFPLSPCPVRGAEQSNADGGWKLPVGLFVCVPDKTDR